MDKLPVEVLYTILEHVKNARQPRPRFFSCILCCHLWHDVALPMMYKEINIYSLSWLEFFLDKISSRNLAMVKFLRISVTISREDFVYFSGSRLKTGLRKLSTVLPNMINLSTFSFTYSDFMPGHPRPIRMGRSAITELVKSLPTSCVTLEIDAHGLDNYKDHHEDTSPHFCDTLRDILRQLQHLRLRLADLCPGIFATGFNQDGTMAHQSTITPVVAPFLRTLVINCCAHLSLAGACGTKGSRDAHIPLLQRLCEFAARGSFPAIERLWLVYKPRLDFSTPQYHYYKRCDIIRNQAWCIPFIEGYCYKGYRETMCFMRTPEGRESYVGETMLDPLVEEQTWEYILRRLWVPSVDYIGSDVQRDHDDCFTNVPSHQEIEGCHCEFHTLWYHEEFTGVQHLIPVQREGLLDESPVTRTDSW